MADAIGQNSTLKVVLLHGNQMNSEGISALAESLGTNDSLTHLGLRENGIDGEGAQSLARAINKNTTLVELRLEGNVGIRLADSIFLFACGGNRVKLDLSTNDQRAQVAIAQGNGFRENDVEPEMVPEEVLLMDSPAYANDTAQYFADLQKGEIGQISYLKVLVVGSSEAGKTSLVRSLIECSASSAGSTSSGANRKVAEGPTLGVETYRLPRHGESSSSSSNGGSDGSHPGRVDLFDFGSDAEHFLTHARFLANRSLVVLVVDLTLYGNANEEPTEQEAQVFEETVGRWVRAMQVQLQRSRLMIVGSKGDALGAQEASARMENVLDYLEDMMNMLNADARRDFALGMSGTFIELSLTPDSTFVVSSMDPLFVDGVDSLAESLGMMASDASLGLSLQVPRSYAALREYVEAKASEGVDVLDFEEVRSELGFDDNEYGFEVALKLLHVLGLLQWCDFSAFASSSDPSRARIRHTIFTRPSFVLEALWSLCEGSSEKGTILTPDDVHAALDQYRVIYESVLDEFSLPDGRKWADVPARERSLYLDLLCELDILAEVVDKDAVDHSQRVFRVPILFRLDTAAAAVVPDAAVLRRSVREEQDSRSLYRNNESTGRGRRLSLSPFATSRMHSLHWHYEFPIAFPEGFFARLVSKLHPIMSIGEVNDHYVHGFIRFIDKGGDNGTPGDRRSAARGASDAAGLTARRSRHEPVYVTVFSARDSDARGRMSVRAMTMTPQRGGKGSQPPPILLMIFSQIIRRLDMLLDEFPALPRFELILSGDPRWGLTREELAHPDENGKVIEHLFEVHNVPNSHSSLFRYHVREHAPHRLQDARTVHCTMAPSEALLNYVRVEQGLRGTDLWQFKQQLRSDLKILLDRENPSTKEALWYLEQLLRLKGESFTTMTQTPLADIFELKGADRRNAALLASLVDAFNQHGISRKEVRILIFCIIKLETRIRMKYDVCLLRTMSRDSFTPVYKKQANALFRELTTNHNLTCVMLDDKDFGPEHEEQLDNSHVVLCCISMSYIRKLSDIAAPLRTRGVTQNICRIAFEFAAAHRIDSGAMLGAVVDAAVLRNHSTAQLPGLSGIEVTDVSDLRRRAFGQNVGSLTDSILEQIFPYDKDPAKRRALIEAYPSSS
ncbi:Nucleotide-binding oligomerization domain-containing protein 1 [Hondaea fermentalgiana]|uniref:Nucleotide-binding oligomerization domain-containing protein 1 n=1 Tax=Hondaea fermentalgiana TaxID=2315210 RepID=A0A2R5GNX9_9STRA|nr:Nucleotide-binding oligomerization domain-containing protein 1 [Hondaea fermentalgiana]|eukprot:GBG32590.1 Nucleotide-binding oligomerization domain-containing protein 1 [Hondaea fermentalgiana]